jgi:hypothetical protein
MNIYDLAKQYYLNTEEYDRTVCTGTKDGIAIPMTPKERVLINNYARRWRECIMEFGYSASEFQRALRYARYSRSEIKALLGF